MYALISVLVQLIVDTAASWARMFIALALSVLFGIAVGVYAATHKAAERLILPIIDILQTLPILTFFPFAIFVVLLLIPSTAGINAAVVFLIFTSMSWNIVFGVYEAVKAMPAEFGELSRLYNLDRFERLTKIYIPASLPGLVEQSVLSWSIGLFYLVTSEIFSTGNANYSVKYGIGIALTNFAFSTAPGHFTYYLIGIGVFIAFVVATRFLFFRPLERYANRYMRTAYAKPRGTNAKGIVNRIMRPGRAVRLFKRISVLAEVNFITVIQPFATWYIVIVWYGFILFVDSLVYHIKGKSLISSYPKEVAFMLLISAPFWLIFEFYNLFTHSWYYVNYVYYVHIFDFTTILPALLEAFSLMHALGIGKRFDKNARAGSGEPLGGNKATSIKLLAMAGLAIAVLPVVLGPDGFLFMWIGIALLFEPVNYLAGRPSLLAMAGRGIRSVLVQLSAAGLVMGFFWEFWNYQAYPKWMYRLPSFIINVKLFEMPIEGYVGYIAFAVSVFLFYAFFRGFIFKKHNDLIAM